VTALGLDPKGTCLIATPSTEEEGVETEEYDISFKIPPPTGHQPPFYVGTIAVAATDDRDLAKWGFKVLLGRDILKHMLLSYNGQTKFYTLAYYNPSKQPITKKAVVSSGCLRIPQPLKAVPFHSND